jgi:hypothetical protein
MSGRAEARSKARSAIAESLRPSDSSQLHHITTFLAWCETNGIEPGPPKGHSEAAPTAEEVLLVYLHAMHAARGWSHGQVLGVSGSVARFMIGLGHSDPRGVLFKGWMKAHLREVGARRLPAVGAVLPAEVRAATIRDTAIGGKAVRRRAVLALADALLDAGIVVNPCSGPGMRELGRLRSGAFTLTETQIRVRVGDATAVIGRGRLPAHYDAVAAGVALQGDGPLIVDSNGAITLLRAAVARVFPGVPVNGSGRVRAGTALAEWWTAASREERMHLMARIDGHLPFRIQDATMRLLSISGLHRAAELARLTIGHMRLRADGTGYDYELVEHKGTEVARARGGRGEPLVCAADHHAGPADGGPGCSIVCPACMLALHLELRLESGATACDPLFVSLNGTAVGQVLTSNAVGRMMRGTVEDPDREDGSPRRIGSRSARVTGATELRKAGASYAEIQAAGGWTDATTAALYVRRHDAFTEARLVLPLDAAGG